MDLHIRRDWGRIGQCSRRVSRLPGVWTTGNFDSAFGEGCDMVYGYARQAVLVGVALLLLLFGGARLCAADRTVTGVVVKSGFSGVIVASGGSPVKYQTGRRTVFTPRNYLPGKGDIVSVRFYGKRRADGREALLATAVSLVKKAPVGTEVVASPAVGIVKAVGRKRLRFEFPGKGLVTMEMKRGMKMAPPRWRPAVGDRVRVYYDKVPARFVRKMVLVISRIEKI